MTIEVRTLPPNLKKSKHGAYMSRFSNNGEEKRAKGGVGNITGVARTKTGSPGRLARASLDLFERNGLAVNIGLGWHELARTNPGRPIDSIGRRDFARTEKLPPSVSLQVSDLSDRNWLARSSRVGETKFVRASLEILRQKILLFCQFLPSSSHTPRYKRCFSSLF